MPSNGCDQNSTVKSSKKSNFIQFHSQVKIYTIYTALQITISVFFLKIRPTWQSDRIQQLKDNQTEKLLKQP